MLYLKFSAHLQPLADMLIAELKSAWTDPLAPPMVIFADKKMEQWFRLQWVNQKGVLANFNANRLEAFLWNALQTDPSTQLLTGDILHSIIQAALVSTDPEKGIPQWQKWKNLQRFLARENQPAVPDSTKLTELSAELARLFLEYEYSRPQQFYQGKAGILDCWKQGHSVPFFSTGEEDPIETWQRELYDIIFHDKANSPSFMSRANATSYLTLTYLYNSYKENLQALSGQPIFIFGLSGAGQFHRVILQEIATKTSVHAYIQNPCAEFWEDINTDRRTWKRSFTQSESPANLLWKEDLENGEEPGISEKENQLLQLWGQTGRENIKLWCEASDYNFQALDEVSPPANLLGTVQTLILNRTNTVSSRLSNDDSLTLTEASSRRNEVECLREQIWKDLEENRMLRLDEMIVLVPDLEGYRVAIEQVFGAQEPFGKEFLPFAFGDAREKASFVAGAIGTFLQIVQNKEINRPNFFDLLRNPVVQKARGITEGTLAEWEKWILGMNVFRSRESAEISNPHSWNHGIRRLLLYRLMRTPYSFEGIVFHPYGTLESNDDDSLNAFCKSIESLESFIAKFHQKNSPIRQRELFFDFCREWIDAENDPAESSVQKNLFHTLFSVDWQERAGRKELPFEELKILVERALTQTRPGNSEFLLSGISFVKFKPDRALPMKIIYMLGMNANDFPGKFNPSTLDLRTPTEKRQKRWPGDSNPISKNRYAFLCELMSATLKLRISYLGYNAKKDEPLSASSVVEELKTFLENNVLEKGTTWNTRKVTFNEKRAVNDIYSTRSLYQKFLTFEDAAPASAMPVSAKIAGRIPMEIRAQQIQRFLQNPFEFQISTSLHLPEEEEDETRIPFEPIGLNSLFHAILGKRLFHENLSNGTLGESEIQRCEEQGYLPEGPFAERAKSQLRKIVQRQIEKIDTPQEYHAGDPVEWELKKNGYLITKFTGTPEWVRGDASQSITLLSTCSGTPSFRHYLHPFVCTMIIAAKANTRQKFSIWVISGKEGKESESREFEISPAEAAAWLEKIAALAFENRFRINVPVTLVEEYYNEGSLPSREEFLDDLSKESFGKYWPYRSGESALFSEADWSIPETESAFISTITAHASLFKKLFETRSQAKAVQ